MFEIRIIELLLLKNFVRKQKCLNLEPKITYFDIFDPKLIIWIFFGRNFRKTIVMFEISNLKLVYLQNFTKKQKSLNSGPEMPHLGILRLELENNIVIFEISTLEFVLL